MESKIDHTKPPQALMMQFLNGMIVTRCIGTVADLRIADLLQGGPKDAAYLSEATRANADALYRILRLLAGLGIFAEEKGRQFRNTKLSEVLAADASNSVRDYALWLCTNLHWRVVGDLDHSVRTGAPAITKDDPEKSPLDVLFSDPDAEIFNQAMTGLSRAEGRAVVDAYDFTPYAQVVDVGGGHGHLAVLIARSSPRTRVTVQDLPQVVEGARRRISEENLQERLGTAEVSFFDGVAGPADVCLLKHIVHGWRDEEAVRILRNCRSALSENGRVLVCEMVVGSDPQSVPAKLMDIEMLVGPGGRERTEDEYAALFDKAGLRLERVIRTHSPLCLLEASAA